MREMSVGRVLMIIIWINIVCCLESFLVIEMVCFFVFKENICYLMFLIIMVLSFDGSVLGSVSFWGWLLVIILLFNVFIL